MYLYEVITGYGADRGGDEVTVVPLTFGLRLILPAPVIEPYFGAGLGIYFADLKEPGIDDSDTTIGGFEVFKNSAKKYFDAGPGRIPPLTIPTLIVNEAAGNISMLNGIHGPSWTLATACASGTDALGAALDMVRSGRVDMCLSGGTEAAITVV